MRVPPLPRSTSERRSITARSFGILSTYPPTACGLATFSAALGRGLIATGAEVGIVEVADVASSPAPPVVAHLVPGSRSSIARAAEALNEFDAAIVQHEYGIYGGADGDDVLAVLEEVTVPSIVVAHTVLREPTRHQREVLVAVGSLAEAVVVMSEAARVRLCSTFDIDPDKVVTISHGAFVPLAAPRPQRSSRPILLTTGLIGPGKGIERVIDAMGSLHRLPSRPRYMVSGQTHPKVFAAHGDRYRNDLVEQAWKNGSAAAVTFDATYRDVASLTTLLQSAIAIVLPYDSTDQVTSGVLVDAIAAGRPVVATAFPHAVELLASGAGLVVDHDDPEAMATALRRVLTEHGLAERMAAEARRIAPSLSWSVVARAYSDLVGTLLSNRELLV